MAPDPEVLRGRLAALGFDVVRFTDVSDVAPGTDAFHRWLEAGNHADMRWLEKNPERRSDPRNVLTAATSMILLGVNYGDVAPVEGRPVWARYAQNRDYHDSIKPALVQAGKELEEWAGVSNTDYRYYVDTGPVLERSWASRAGVGFIGKNAMLISRDFGNWLLLSAIIVRVSLPADPPVSRLGQKKPVGTLCGSCTACLDACPTGALPSPGVVDARRCISYQTIENKGIIPRELRTAIGERIYGCDICAEVCPWNRFAQRAKSGLIEARPQIAKLDLKALLTLTPATFAAVFKGTPIKRLKLRGLLRNACIVAANQARTDLRPELLALAADADEAMVRAHAVWAVRRLGGEAVILARLQARETDPEVLAEFAGEV